MKKEELESFLSKKGYKKDRWGHYHKGDVRYKMQKTSVRIERKITSGWFKLYSYYYKDIEINPETRKIRRKK